MLGRGNDMCDAKKKLENLENRVIEGMQKIKKERKDSGLITLQGEEGNILYDLCTLVASPNGDPLFLKYSGVVSFEGVSVICE